MDNARKNEIKAVVLFAGSLFLFLSLFTFSEQDLSFYTSDPGPSFQNLTGVAGAYISGILLFLIGGAAYVIPLLTLVWGASRLFQLEQRRFFFKLFGLGFLVTAVSAGLSMLQYSSRTLAFARGGLIGTLVSGFLIKYLGMAGAAVFILATMVLSVLIATEFLILPLVIPVFRGIFKFIAGIPARAKAYAGKRARVPALSGRKIAGGRLKQARQDIAEKLVTMKGQVERSRRTPLAESRARPAVRGRDEAGGTVKADPAQEASGADSPDGGTSDYNLPGLDLLKSPVMGKEKEREDALMKSRAVLLEKTLSEFSVSARVVEINRGPVITMYELEPAVGTKVGRITSLGDNISLAMRSAEIRIVAPLPGKGTIGIEIPNKKSELVRLRDVVESREYAEDDSQLKIALGKEVSGIPMIVDLAAMPHLLIAGATGSGKTVCINSIISSLLLGFSPQELKFLMVDPKRVELMMFEGIPHLVSPIVTSPKKVAAALGWVISEMERRYDIFAGKGVRNITFYNQKKAKDWEGLPYIVVIIDELADLMAVSQQEIEGAIMRLAQLSRAAGIHMILATQRPSVNVITGVIKANFPARISFKVTSKVDSRTVLDANGAEKLLGRGDMLLMEPGRPDIIRGQCSLVDDGEIKNIVGCIRAQAAPRYLKEVLEKQEKREGKDAGEKDELYSEAVKVIMEYRQASVSIIQRKLRVGYSRAARLIDVMEEEGIVGPYNRAKPREILVDSIEDLPEGQ